MTEKNLSAAGKEIVEALTAFHQTLKRGGAAAVARKFTVRTVRLDLEPRSYTGDDVKKVRSMIGLSQVLFARFLGVSVNAVRSWENGGKKPSKMACRFLDEIADRPAAFRKRISKAIVWKPRGRQPTGAPD
jgi:putative transcriptional regulator